MEHERRVAVVAPVAGLLLGVLDFVWIKYLPFPLAGLGNSIAVWAVAAFLFTLGNRWSMPLAVCGAIVMLVVAVPAYYAAAALIQRDDWANLWAVPSLLWMGLGVVAGAFFGAGGVLARTPGRLRLPALALPAAVLLAELIIELRRLGDAGYDRHDTVGYAAVLAILAVAVTVLVGRTWRDRALALVCAVPLSVVGHLLLVSTAFRGDG
ncbi:DUF6518 family protein [Actinoplanes sp. NPDC051494]|uniref:DUF6518 family protein n=1 Tax=Actinoplanes sp. NPDC051494 TaxID=3363907 RepID=UPI00378E160C